MLNYDLDKLYNLTLTQFQTKLSQETGLTFQDLINLNNFEIRCLRDHYKNLVSTRDSPEFDLDLTLLVQKLIEKKSSKSIRYAIFQKNLKRG